MENKQRLKRRPSILENKQRLKRRPSILHLLMLDQVLFQGSPDGAEPPFEVNGVPCCSIFSVLSITYVSWGVTGVNSG